MIKTILAWIGGAVVIMGLIGMAGAADFRLCFAPHGHCDKPKAPASGVKISV